MHRWFAVSMIVLFVSTLLMMYFDHHDEWRAYQHQFFQLEADRIVAEENAKKAELTGVAIGTGAKSAFNFSPTTCHNFLNCSNC